MSRDHRSVLHPLCQEDRSNGVDLEGLSHHLWGQGLLGLESDVPLGFFISKEMKEIVLLAESFPQFTCDLSGGRTPALLMTMFRPLSSTTLLTLR